MTTPGPSASTPGRSASTLSARLALAGALGLSGGVLGVLAGLTQSLVGDQIPTWSGSKSNPLGLGLMTVVLSGVAIVAALGLRRSSATSPGRRAAAVAGLLIPAGICLSTAGRLWYLPAALLAAAAITAITAGGAGAMIQATRAHWLQILLSVLGGLQLLPAISAAPILIALIGAVGAALLVAAPWLPIRPALRMGLIAVTVLPFAVLTWTSVVTPVIALLALCIGAGWWRGTTGTQHRRPVVTDLPGGSRPPVMNTARRSRTWAS